MKRAWSQRHDEQDSTTTMVLSKKRHVEQCSKIHGFELKTGGSTVYVRDTLTRGPRLCIMSRQDSVQVSFSLESDQDWKKPFVDELEKLLLERLSLGRSDLISCWRQVLGSPRGSVLLGLLNISTSLSLDTTTTFLNSTTTMSDADRRDYGAFADAVGKVFPTTFSKQDGLSKMEVFLTKSLGEVHAVPDSPGMEFSLKDSFSNEEHLFRLPTSMNRAMNYVVRCLKSLTQQSCRKQLRV